MLSAEGLTLGQACHSAVIIHDLAEHARGVEPRQPRHVYRSLGVAGPFQHAAGLGSQREHVPRHEDIFRAGFRVDDRLHRGRAIVRGNTGGSDLLGLDRNGERGALGGSIALHHEGYLELVQPPPVKWHTNKAAAVGGMEVEGFRRHLLCGNDEVALILPRLIIDDDDHFAGAKVF